MASEIGHIIRGRRSIRRYTDRPVSREVVETLLSLAIWSPSAHNRQPWRFAVTEQGERRERLAQAMGEQLRADLTVDGVSAEAIAADTGRSYARITAAPIVIIAALSLIDMDHYPDPRRSAAEHLMAVQSTAMTVQNILLAAHAEGLGACWMCAPLFCPEVVRDALALPDDWQPQALITLGYPAVTRASTRHSLETRLLWR